MSRPAFTPNRRAMLTLLAATPFVAACEPQTEGPEEVRMRRGM